ncbi:MAG: hypothetical protein JWQ11_273, partial [Rhizobacter sp.]|nr:hypothetical protein [Rhizobacter sp.]
KKSARTRRSPEPDLATNHETNPQGFGIERCCERRVSPILSLCSHAMNPISRRIFLKATGAVAITPAAVDSAGAATDRHTKPQHAGDAAAGAADNAPAYMFLSEQEQAFIEAAVERLIPPDEVGPSAIEAGVPGYLDKQLGGAWGAGERLFRGGPWHEGTPSQGYQLPLTPAELFRTAMRGIHDELQATRHTTFDKLPGAEQDRYLTQLQAEHRDLAGVPSNVFFESLLAMTIEGYFSDPAYGGNKDMASWKMIGFPGAYGAYYDLVDQHGVAFKGEPRSLAQDGRGHVHLEPNLNAMPGMTSMAPQGVGAQRASRIIPIVRG